MKVWEDIAKIGTFRSALVIIDMQNDFITGPLGSNEARIANREVAEYIKECSKHVDCIFYTMDNHDTDYRKTREGQWLEVPHCRTHTPGWCLTDEVRAALDGVTRVPIEVNKYNTFAADWNLATEGVNYDKIHIMGVCTDICVLSNALALRTVFPEAVITVHAERCAGTTPENHEMALKMMQQNHIRVLRKAETCG